MRTKFTFYFSRVDILRSMFLAYLRLAPVRAHSKNRSSLLHLLPLRRGMVLTSLAPVQTPELYCIVFRHKTRTSMLITKHYGWKTRQNALTVAYTTTNKPYQAILQERTLIKEDTLKTHIKKH